MGASSYSATFLPDLERLSALNTITRLLMLLQGILGAALNQLLQAAGMPLRLRPYFTLNLPMTVAKALLAGIAQHFGKGQG